jgi:hypothetical protein
MMRVLGWFCLFSLVAVFFIYENNPRLRANLMSANYDTSNSLSVEMSAEITSDNPPLIKGSTNLPDGTELIVHLLDDPPRCDLECGLEYKNVTVENGRFSAFPKDQSVLNPGVHTIDIVTPFADRQPPQVQAIIGSKGQNLRGPLIEVFDPDSHQYVPAASDPDGKLFGFSVHYTKTININ